MGMRGGANRASQALYRPGSGPLRKSGRSTDDLDNENISQEKPKSSSVQHRLKQSQLNRSNQMQNSPPSSQVENVTDKLNDLNINYRSITNIEQAQGSSQNSNFGDSRRKSKKPEQQLYVPKKVKEALAEQDVTNRSPNQGGWERDQEREHSEDRDSHSNRSHKSDSHRNRAAGHGRKESESGSKNRDEHGKRYSGNRRTRNSNENEERWRSDSPLSSRKPLFVTTNHLNDFNRTRDTRSVEPAGYPEKFQGKPPSGKWGGTKDSLPKNIKIEHLPPRLQKKYLLDNGLPLPPSSSPSEDTWSSSNASSNYNFPPAMQHSQTMQSLPPSGPLPPQSNWSNTAPSRSRGRGRLRQDELESSANVFRCVTPDQYSAPSSRSHTPSQEYMQRSYDRRGSNSTMYTSMESLSRVDSSVIPPSSTSPVTSVSSMNKRQTSPESHRRGISPPVPSHRTQMQRASTTSERDIVQETKNGQQNSGVSPSKTESVNTALHTNTSIEHPFDWSEEVELNEKLEAERASRSSSVLSLRENVNVSGNETTSSHSRRKKKKRVTAEIKSVLIAVIVKIINKIEKMIIIIIIKKTVTIGGMITEDIAILYNVAENLAKIEIIAVVIGILTTFIDIDENWRTGRKMSACDSDDGRQTPSVSSHSVSLANTLTTHQTSPSGYTSSQPPGVLVLPDTSQSPPSHPISRQQGVQQQRTLFDPNNPNKPIVITSPSSRAAVQRENETTSQGSSIPVFQSHGERADLELQWILSSGGFTSNWERVLYIRHFLQESLKTLLETDIKFCQAENVEQHFWKILFYNMIEMLRKGMPKESSERREHYKKIMLKIIDDGTIYLESLLTVLETKYEFKLDTFLASSTLPKGLGILGLALVSAQKIYLFLGDLARYREQATETNNYGKSRQWYLKAQQLNPKNGKPYNQLALLAHYARRKLDAVYYYMRSLMASNPFHSARESLIALFDENRKKYESTERKRKEEREWKERARMKEKEGANSIGGGLRREIWIHPGGRRVRRTTTAATANEARLSHSDLEELAQLSSVEVNKRFVTSYLHVHGKLFNKIGTQELVLVRSMDLIGYSVIGSPLLI
ncbi:Telomerase-binding protein EST1A [Eufriesea mexicana]|nr:Telomerase-binding protein EST1A [Eufriesea mexicana]